MTVDDKIVYHRKRLGLTQKQLADYLGITVRGLQVFGVWNSESTFITYCCAFI